MKFECDLFIYLFADRWMAEVQSRGRNFFTSLLALKLIS